MKRRLAVLAALCLSAVCLLCPPALAAAPMVKTQAPGFYRLMLGDFEVTVLSDGSNKLPALKLLHGDASEISAALRRSFLGEEVETSHNGFLINTGSKLVLIDPGAGAMLGPSTGALIGNLRSAGYRPEQVDEILITHLHTDHVGGLVANGRMVFPNAVLRIDKHDTDYWLSEARMRAAPEDARRFFQAAMAAVKPYSEAGRLKVFDGRTELLAGVRAEPAYGHTPGHTAYAIESKGERLLVWGDVVHVAAVQFADPSVTIGYDVDAPAAVRERLRILAEAAAGGYLVAGAHLPFPGIGHVLASGERAYAFVPLPSVGGLASPSSMQP
ncbi:MAG TPA: MBL fold metallo-hydrolase [Burkholderiaceae bacterium]|nr:MBL fold metallo-hydrolase [Burkholderiaceae bacterium]